MALQLEVVDEALILPTPRLESAQPGNGIVICHL